MKEGEGLLELAGVKGGEEMLVRREVKGCRREGRRRVAGAKEGEGSLELGEGEGSNLRR